MENVATEEFISRTEALKDFESCNAENPNWTPQRVKTLLLRQPAADVAEVRHGRWEFLGPNRLIKSCMCGTCSVCHVRSVYIVNTAICPNCGAPMDKEDEHEAN